MSIVYSKTSPSLIVGPAMPLTFVNVFTGSSVERYIGKLQLAISTEAEVNDEFNCVAAKVSKFNTYTFAPANPPLPSLAPAPDKYNLPSGPKANEANKKLAGRLICPK